MMEDEIQDMRDEMQSLKDQIEELRIENKELNGLFDLQHKRSVEADKLWQEAHNKPGVIPDLGKLIEWLMAERNNAYNEGYDEGYEDGIDSFSLDLESEREE